jgi:addiction module HigA family antidote
MSGLNRVRKRSELVRAPTPPGEILRDEFLAQNNVTQDEFARAIGMSRLTVNQLINGKRSVTAETALRLAVATGTSPNFWLDLQRNLDLYEARKKLGESLSKIKVVLKPPARKEWLHEIG